MIEALITVGVLLVVGVLILLSRQGSATTRQRIAAVLDYVRIAVAAVEQLTVGKDWGDISQEQRNAKRVDMALQYIKAYATTLGLKWNPFIEKVVRGAIEWEVTQLFLLKPLAVQGFASPSVLGDVSLFKEIPSSSF